MSREAPADGARLSETLREPGPALPGAAARRSCLPAGARGKEGCEILGGPAPSGRNSSEAVRRSASTSFTSASAPWPASRCFQRFYFPLRCFLLGVTRAMQFPCPFSWLTLLWAIYLDPQCKIFLCTISSYYSRINQDHFHVKCQQKRERESFIAEAVQTFPLCSGTGITGPSC